MNVALAHDSFTQEGGAEKVVRDLHEIFPNAPVFTLVLDKKMKESYRGWDIKTSWLQFLYNFHSNLQHFLPLIPLANSGISIKNADAVISSSSGLIKSIKVARPAVHINYCHTPPRFIWSEPEYVNQEVPALLRPIARLFIHYLRQWDYKTAQKIDYFIANSSEVRARIKKYYGRDSEIIYPGIDTDFWKKTREKGNYFLLAGRLQAHKKNDIIIEVFNDLGLPLRVAGTGRQEKFLKSIAKKNITFLGRVADEALRDEYSGALGLIYPQLEDFGLMPLEAAACGTATIGLAKGGSLETIVPGVTGELFNSYDKDGIKHIIRQWDAGRYGQERLREHAKVFDRREFGQKIKTFVDRVLVNFEVKH